MRLVELDRDLVAGGEGACGTELGDVLVDGDHPSAAPGQADGGVPLAAAEVEDAAPRDLTEQPALELGADAGAEVDRLE